MTCPGLVARFRIYVAGTLIHEATVTDTDIDGDAINLIGEEQGRICGQASAEGRP